MVVKLPRMKDEEIRKLVRGQMLCRIAFKGDDYPYMAPFQYVYMKRCLYFHFTHYGRKMKLLDRDERVCVEIERYKADLSEYSFVVITGRLAPVTDPAERSEAIRRMAEQGRRRLSTNFLVAHGFGRDEDWSSFTPDKPLFIVKLGEVVEEMGLKSP